MPGRLLPSGILLLTVLAGACAPARRPRQFRPAAPEDHARVLTSWGQALERGASLPPSRLLYEARLSRGLGKVRGTLALTVGESGIAGTLAGPFGQPLARIVGGVVEAEGGTPFPVEPEELKALLAGTWPFGPPEVRGVEGEDALLSWSQPRPAQGVLNLSSAQLVSLSLEDPRGAIEARYEGGFSPWPEQIELTEKATGNRLRLKLTGREPDAGARPGSRAARE